MQTALPIPIPPEISRRFQWLRLPLIVGVIVAHADPTGVQGLPAAEGTAGFILRLIADVWARNNVSLLFLIAGFLFFHSFDLSWASYCSKLERRLHSLLIPYLFWNALNLLLLAAQQALPIGSALSSQHELVASYTLYQWVDAFAGLSGTPVAYPFWFIRDLMLMILFAPLFHLLARRLPWLTALALYLYWFLSPDTIVLLGPRSLLFFYLGALWALQKPEIGWVDRRWGWVLGAYMIISLLDAARMTEDRWLHHTAMTLGVLVFWILAGRALRSAKLSAFLARWAPASFFVFAVHEPTLTILKKTLFRLLQPANDWYILGLYLLLIGMTLAIGMLAYTVSHRLAPGLTRLVSGGR